MAAFRQSIHSSMIQSQRSEPLPRRTRFESNREQAKRVLEAAAAGGGVPAHSAEYTPSERRACRINLDWYASVVGLDGDRQKRRQSDSSRVGTSAGTN